ncbi:bifunctional diaminohydroxyphosphoribosylaminopyrimidine deaminase/5-amino-6-(5-phosphoribosylamino)uracil reductase RibD [bacterium]|nr:bifunctional diaminohydroxyphosphoribosylaminopyrimidine deaminase/5-amino-6-(5-phosphoribosylamino)uracil reductase RibD [bacterium]
MGLQQDSIYMQQAHQLATRGLGKTWPNPLVGAVVVKNGTVVGKGWHRHYGGPHAEIFALRQAGGQAKDAVLYVNLEPCSHYGKTPPCAEAVIRYGITRVVCSMRDPHKKVSGRGFKILRRAGIRVEIGLMKKAAENLNRVFIKRVTQHRPFVINKIAMSLDGKIACVNGASRWVSGRHSRRYAHQLRALADVIVVGMGTAIKDDPLLTIRDALPKRNKMPLRIILEGRRRVPHDLSMFKEIGNQDVIIVSAKSNRSLQLRDKRIERWHIPGSDGQVDLDKLLLKLGEMKMSIVMVEGGAQTHAAFLGLKKRRSQILCDEMHVMLAPKIFGGHAAPGPVGGVGVKSPDKAVIMTEMMWEKMGDDILIKAYPRKE